MALIIARAASALGPSVGADVDRAVVLDGDLGAGLVLDLVDHLALGADDLADLVDRDLDRDDPRRVRRHLVGRVDRLVHHVEDVQPGVLGLGQRRGQHRGGDAVELGVQLERGDELRGAGDLEVHVAERVLGAEDVGQRDVLASRRRRCRRPGPSRCRRPARAAAHRRCSSDMVEAQTEPIEVEPLEPSASDT